jgi:lipopolysaccharide biosynthesis glycosyltransferase
MKDRETVVYACDATYWTHVFVSLTSLLTTNPDRGFDVFVLSHEVDTRFDEAVDVLRARHPQVTVERRTVDARMFTASPRPLPHVQTASSYYRLLIGELLPSDRRRALYLDADTIVRGPIDELLDLDLGGAVLAAVPHVELPEKLDLSALDLPPDAPYFNAGVLRIDLVRWRDEQIGVRGLDALAALPAEAVPMMDQDVLNHVLHGRWKPVSPTWNHTPWNVDPTHPEHSAPEPTIVHYAGPDKPWNYRSRHDYRADYRRWRRQTPYRSDPLTGTPGVAGRLRHRLGRIVRSAPGGEAALRVLRRSS